MICYQYFIRKTNVPYTLIKKIQCIRVPEGDTHIPELTETFKKIGWTRLISYPSKPSENEEIFKLKMEFQGWNDKVEIESLDTAKEKNLV